MKFLPKVLTFLTCLIFADSVFAAPSVGGTRFADLNVTLTTTTVHIAADIQGVELSSSGKVKVVFSQQISESASFSANDADFINFLRFLAWADGKVLSPIRLTAAQKKDFVEVDSFTITALVNYPIIGTWYEIDLKGKATTKKIRNQANKIEDQINALLLAIYTQPLSEPIPRSEFRRAARSCKKMIKTAKYTPGLPYPLEVRVVKAGKKVNRAINAASRAFTPTSQAAKLVIAQTFCRPVH